MDAHGYVFVAGHWDYPIDQRGMLFTPVSFTSPIYLNRAFVYTPQYLVALNNLVDNLFVCPGFQTCSSTAIITDLNTRGSGSFPGST